MASGKYKPALFELVKPSKKPESGGTLATPKWFYTGKKVGTEPLRGEAVVTETNAPVAPADKAIATKAEIPASGDEATQRYRFSPSASMPEVLASRKVTITLSYWLLGLALLTLIAVVIGAYRLGQGNPPRIAPVGETTGTGVAPGEPASEMPSEPVAEVPAEQIAEPIAPAAEPVEDLAAAAPTASAAPGTRGEGITLIICSNTQLRNLKPVQQYFNTSGIDTRIGRYGGRYVLYSSEVFESLEATKSLRAQVKELGMHYNDKKPRTAPRFKPETFASAYPVNTDRITKDF